MKSGLWILAIALGFTSCKPAVEEAKECPAPRGRCSYARFELNPMGKPSVMVEEALFITLAKEDSANSRKDLNNKLLKGYLGCVREDSVIGIYFDFKIFSPTAFDDYGLIMQGNKINFRLRSGQTVSVPFKATLSGNTNLSSDITEYQTIANISADDAAVLKASELESVSVSWSKKEEEYKVVNPGIFQSQIPCVE